MKGIVFDFGGVMTTAIMPDRVRPIVAELGIPWEALETGFGKYRRQMDGGFIDIDEMYRRIWADAGVELDEKTHRHILEEDLKSFISRNELTLEWMRRLKARGLKLGILTNMPARFAPIFRREYHDFVELTDAMVISGEEKMYKPMRCIYDLLRERIGLAADDIWFIDDVESNCQGARDAGWHTVRFIDNAQAERELDEHLA